MVALPQWKPPGSSFCAQSQMKADWGRFGGVENQIFMACDNRQVYIWGPELWAFLAHLPAVPSVSPGRCQSHSDFRGSCLTSPATYKGQKDSAHLALGKRLCCRSIYGEAIPQRKPIQYLPDFHLSPFASCYYRHMLLLIFFSSLLLQKATRLNQLCPTAAAFHSQ